MRKLNLLASVVLALAAAPALAAPAPQSGSVQIGPSYTMDPALTDQGAPRGREFKFKLPMAQSKIFTSIRPGAAPAPGVNPPTANFDAATWERQISVYVPASYRDGDAAPFTIVHDGPHAIPSILSNWFEFTTRALDNLSGDKDPNRRLPPFIAIGIQSGPLGQRGAEYGGFNDDNARFIHDEVLPAILANPEIRAAYPRLSFTANPDGHAIMGCGSGAVAALNAAWLRPEWFRRVAAYSGGYYGVPYDAAVDPARPLVTGDYHAGRKLIETTPRKPLRVFTLTGEHDNNFWLPEEGGSNNRSVNLRMTAALQKQGYDHRFVHALRATHCDIEVVKSTMGDTLAWLWQGYR